MPELPEVETIKKDLDKHLIGCRIVEVIVRDNRILKTNTLRQFKESITGKTIFKITRRGKLIILHLKEGGHLLVHLKMTGQLIYGGRLDLKDTKAVLALNNGKFLNFNDQRLFGRLSFVRHLEDDQLLVSLGPEPFKKEFNEGWLHERCQRHMIPIKTLLLDQHFIAGIGNIYASEILFDAGISPTKPARRLSKKEINALHGSTIRVLKEAIRWRGTSMRNYRDSNGEKGSFINRIKVYNKEDQPCPRCGCVIQRIKQSGRSTYFCQRCQH